jgi:hypothetical protein
MNFSSEKYEVFLETCTMVVPDWNEVSGSTDFELPDNDMETYVLIKLYDKTDRNSLYKSYVKVGIYGMDIYQIIVNCFSGIPGHSVEIEHINAQTTVLKFIANNFIYSIHFVSHMIKNEPRQYENMVSRLCVPGRMRH